MKKKSTILILSILAIQTLCAFELPYFSGYAGFLGGLTLEPDFTAQAFFSGQTDFSGKVICRTEFYVDADNLNPIKKPSTDEKNALFNIQEASVTVKLHSLYSTHFISAFLGEYEPIGSDIFLQRQFGILPITSLLTESWHGLNGASVYPTYGFGASYIAHIGQSYAAGFYLFNNDDSTADTRSIDSNVRFAMLKPRFSFDMAGGISFVYEDQTYNAQAEEIDVILLIRYVSFHAGCNLLVGNRYTTSLFMQAGISNLIIDPSGEHKKDPSIYFLFEPRFVLSEVPLKIHTALFCLPFTSQDNMVYVNYNKHKDFDTQASLGANVCIFNDHLYISTTNITLGTHLTVDIMGTDLLHLSKISTGNMQVVLSPFASFPILGGTLESSLSVSFLDFKDKDSRNNAFVFRLGFSSHL